MAKRSRADELGLWKSRLAAASQIIESDLRPDWEERLRNWRGEYWVDDGTDGHRVGVNMVWGIVSLFQAALYFHDPRVLCSVKKAGAEQKAQFGEALFNYYLEELGTGVQAKRCIKDALLFDAAYMKLGYEVEFDTTLDPLTDDAGDELYDGDDNPFLSDPQGNLYVERDGRRIQVMEKDGELVPQEQEQPTLNEFIRRESPFGIRWSPLDVLRDPEGRYVDLSDSRWIAFRSVLPLDEVKGNPEYRNTGKLEATKTVRRDLLEDNRRAQSSDDPDTDRVEVYEIWCKEWNRTKRRYDLYQKVIAEGHDQFLLHRRAPYLADGFPCKVLTFDEDPERPYGWSPLRAIDDQIASMNLCRAQALRIQDQQIAKWIYNKQVLTDEEFTDFAESPLSAGIGLKNFPPELGVGNAMTLSPIPQVSPDINLNYDRARDEIQLILGVTDYQMGGGGGPKRQATEAGLINSGYTIRVEEKRNAVGAFLVGIVKYWAMLLRQFGDYERALKITNDVGQEEWVQFKIADAITDELDFSVDVFQSAFQSRDIQQKQAMDRFNLLRQDPLVNPQKLIEDVVRSFGIRDVAAYLAPPQQAPPQVGPDGQPLPVESIASSGGMVDINQYREPAATDAGATGRAIG